VSRERPLVLNGWSGAAAVLVVAALVAFASVVSGPLSSSDSPLSSSDSKTFYSLGPTLLAGSTVFAALHVMERGSWLVGFAALLAVPFGWILAVYGIWHESSRTSDAVGAFWTGVLVLVVAVMVATSSLLAQAAAAKVLAVGAVAGALVATFISVDAAWRQEPFWRDGTAITTAWIVAVSLYFLVPIVDRILRRSLLWLAAGGVLVVASGAGIVALLSGEFSPQGYSIFFTLITATLTSASFLGGVVARERGDGVVGWSAIVVSPLALAMLVDGIWHDSDDRFRYISTGIALALALLVASPAFIFMRSRTLVALAATAGVLAAAAAAVSIDAIWRKDRYLLLAKTTTALWILAIACCLLVPLVERYLIATDPTPA
jgi:hypothetical protein